MVSHSKMNIVVDAIDILLCYRKSVIAKPIPMLVSLES